MIIVVGFLFLFVFVVVKVGYLFVFGVFFFGVIVVEIL